MKTLLTICDDCQTEIDWDEDGGHIYPDGSTVCSQCEGETK